MRQIVASRVAPMPDFDVLMVPDSVAAQGEAAMVSGESGTAHGFVVIRPDTEAAAGDLVPFLPLPLLSGERR